ncbi:hypothetical protein [Hymenobacter cheonanensis]|uniref:hypothetical protein n=1 Tax=Hymenobacter sp. CA2-7 TaxID=3063993 RepID=UPI002713964D|nr:hypothetical protein [Hymenobacter sp. CA2-7]MDO7885337.1 hypothetical protein [Hymenobacter sp. CA2-7]
MDNTLAAFLAYFRRLATDNLALRDFVHGPSGRIIAGSRRELTYPLLWLETPSLALADKDGTAPLGQRHAALIVLDSASASDYADQDAKWASTEAIALEVLSRMRRDYKARQFVAFSLDGTVLEAVATLTVAGEIGWRFEFSLSDYPAPLTYDATRWH